MDVSSFRPHIFRIFKIKPARAPKEESELIQIIRMKFRHKMSFLFQGNDYPEEGLLLPEDEPDATGLYRVIVLFKILAINLTLGCIVTLFCFTLKRACSDCLSLLFCGLCNGFFIGSSGKRSQRVSRSRCRKIKHNRNRRKTGKGIIGSSSDDFECEHGFSEREKRSVIKIFFVLVGLLGGYKVSTSDNRASALIPDPILPIHSLSDNASVFNTSGEGQATRLFVVTPTPASGIQAARLTRMAQALYPSREFITWVIVSADPVKRSMWTRFRSEHWGTRQIKDWRGDKQRIVSHLDDLQETVARFGIPFVILSAHDIHHSNLEFNSAQLQLQQSFSTIIKASQVGLSWVVKSFQNGVLLQGLDDGSYHYNLFPEVRHTKFISSWPTAFDQRYRFHLSFSAPITRLRENITVTQGYFAGGVSQTLNVPLKFGGYAVNLKLAQQLDQQLWKLSLDQMFNSEHLNLEIEEIEPLGKKCTRIYFWKTVTSFVHNRGINSEPIPLKFKWLNSNVQRLHDVVRKWFATDL